MQTDVHKALCPFYAKEIAPFYGSSHKKCTALAAIAWYIALNYKIEYTHIFQAGYFLKKKQIAVVFNKTTIMSLFYLERFASIT